MKKRILTILVLILIVVVCILAVFLNSDYYYSRKLVSAIREENIIAVQQIIEEKPTCINTYPSITSKWWHSAMNWRVSFPLNEACITNNLDIVTLLLENGADPNCNDGTTPLSITYSLKCNNWYSLSLILIEYGASLDYVTEYSGGNSSIFQDIVKVRSGVLSIECGKENEEEVIAAFFYAIENCDYKNVDWFRVFQHSVSNDRIEIVKFLLDNEYCSVNDISNGMTPLMFAARDSTLEMVNLLLEYGADKTYKSFDGNTAFDYAIQSNNQDIALVLKD